MPKAPEHIEAFQQMVGFILGKLYDVHPTELSSDIDAFFISEWPTDTQADLFEDTVKYLVRHGFLHKENFYLQLTPASWDVLQRPDPLDVRRTLGSALASWAKDTASETGKALTIESVTTLMKLVFQGVTGGDG